MSRDETQVATILRELQERAKELNCLYRVDELLNRPELPLELIFRSIVEILPHGWQYPHECQARIIFENNIIESANFQPTSWTQSANLVVQGVPVGAVEVSYSRTDAAFRRRAVPERRAQADRDDSRSHCRAHHAAALEVGFRRIDWRRTDGRVDQA